MFSLMEESAQCYAASSLEEEQIAALRLVRTPAISSRMFFQLVKCYGGVKQAVEKAEHHAGRGNRAIQLASEVQVRQELAQIRAAGAHFLLWKDASYPSLLHHIPDAPPVLMVMGNLSILREPMLAIVGARNASLNACRFAEQQAAGVVSRGYKIISGLARGIDAAAHRGAGAAHTLAVVGGGVDVIYPRENTALYHAIVQEGGAVISEWPLGFAPRPEFFPRRNRIVAGMALATLVVEAAERSGSLITARLANEYGREVLAVPGFPMDPRASGTNKLIREGATLVTCTEDIEQALRGFRPDYSEDFLLKEDDLTYQGQLGDSKETLEVREVIASLLSPAPTALNEIIAACEGQTQHVLTALLEMELEGEIQRLPGNKVVKCY